MLALTKKTDYALIALCLLAKEADRVVSAREVARASGLPLPILTNILKTLAAGGIVSSARGATGGYALAKPTSAINLYELVTTIEGPFKLVQCAPAKTESDKNCCDHESSCPIRQPVSRIQRRLEAFLKSISLAEIADEPGETVRRSRAESAIAASIGTTPAESLG
jgi:Rrf2 family protein